ncbi:hypothetical protein GCM10028793_31760 [Nocardiopsis oceani]
MPGVLRYVERHNRDGAQTPHRNNARGLGASGPHRAGAGRRGRTVPAGAGSNFSTWVITGGKGWFFPTSQKSDTGNPLCGRFLMPFTGLLYWLTCGKGHPRVDREWPFRLISGRVQQNIDQALGRVRPAVGAGLLGDGLALGGVV